MVEKGGDVAGNAALEIETLCRRHIKNSCLTEEAYSYMTKLIMEDCPKNTTELYNLVQDFITDGMVYTEEEAFKICDILIRIFLEKKLIEVV